MEQLQPLRQKLPAGIADASLSSLGTFAAGLAAVRWLEPADLGVYSVMFAAFLVATLLPIETTFTPIQVSLMGFDRGARMGGIIRSLPKGLRPSFLSWLFILGAGALIWMRTDPEVVTDLAVTAAILAIVSPMQDHVRRGFHISERSWAATSMSGLQLVAVVATLFVIRAAEVEPVWAPLGSLVVGNSLSLALGLLIARVEARSHTSSQPVTVSGRWLAASSITAFGGSLAASVVMTLVAGPEIVGFAEAARTVAQPVLVVATGISAALASRNLRAAASRDRGLASQANRVYYGAVSATGLIYLLVAGFPWSFNPFSGLIPAAYAVGLLIPVTILSNLLLAGLAPLRDQLIASNLEVPMAKADIASLSIPVAVATTALLLGSFARPVGIAIQSVFRTSRYWPLWTQAFSSKSDDLAPATK
jgi:hypothetical protein